jgi:hypothetical protein
MNELKDFDSKLDHSSVRDRLNRSARRLRSVLWKCTLVDTAIVALWLFTAIAPIIGNGVASKSSSSPVSVALLFLLCSIPPIAISAARISYVLRLRKTSIRVDMMINAPTTFRQIAYVSHNIYLGWWMWLGYVGATLYFVFNLFALFVWMLVFGFSFWLSLIIFIETLISTSSVMGCTSTFYTRGVQSNFNQNIQLSMNHANQWARFRANEERRRWKIT